MTRGLLLFAHGARDPNWARPFEAVAERVRTAAPSTPVALGVLEFMTPTLAEAAQQLIGAGCDSVHVVPLFLGAGGHVRKDLPDLLARFALLHPRVKFQVHPAIGEADAVVEAMARAALTLCDSAPTEAS